MVTKAHLKFGSQPTCSIEELRSPLKVTPPIGTLSNGKLFLIINWFIQVLFFAWDKQPKL